MTDTPDREKRFFLYCELQSTIASKLIQYRLFFTPSSSLKGLRLYLRTQDDGGVSN
ncbi:MAG: hypothetical protein GF317_15780 [Candidatus Lokiarchaeota archaeon]|nr:hypothetical protein [Candidatus Lokiarchaeota archaeon]